MEVHEEAFVHPATIDADLQNWFQVNKAIQVDIEEYVPVPVLYLRQLPSSILRCGYTCIFYSRVGMIKSVPRMKKANAKNGM